MRGSDTLSIARHPSAVDSHVLVPATQPSVGAATSTVTEAMIREVGTFPASPSVTPSLWIGQKEYRGVGFVSIVSFIHTLFKQRGGGGRRGQHFPVALFEYNFTRNKAFAAPEEEQIERSSTIPIDTPEGRKIAAYIPHAAHVLLLLLPRIDRTVRLKVRASIAVALTILYTPRDALWGLNGSFF